MTIKTIMVPVLDEATARTSLNVALNIAKQSAAHIIATHVTPDPAVTIPQLMTPVPGAAMTDTLTAITNSALERTQELRDIASNVLSAAGFDLNAQTVAENGVSVEWRDQKGFEADDYARLARTTDLIILTRPTDGFLGDTELFESLLLDSGHPVLLLPAECEFSASRPAIIGWNRSMEAARAVSAALPFLIRAEEVHILTIGDPENTGPDSVDVEAYLKRHDVRAKHRQVAGDSHHADEILQTAAKELSAGMLVVGAYSHSRWREMVFGGVTRRLIESCPFPVFFLH